MADPDENVPPIPTPPTDPSADAAVPPVEATPVTPTPPAVETPVPPPAYGVQPSAEPAAQTPYGQQPTAPYGQAPAAPGAYAPAPAGPAQGLAITSMVLGISGIVLALFGFGFLPALAAVITGHLAQRRQPWAKPFWLTGIVTGYVGVGIGLLTFLFFLIVFVVGFGSLGYLGY